MALPSYYISTSVTCVNTTSGSKILMLPPAQTIPNVNLYIYDSGGAAATNPIYVSTQQGDEMDNGKSTITMNANNQAFRITPYSNSKYAICVNYTEGLTPFQYALRLAFSYTQGLLTVYDYTSSAISSDGSIVIVTGGGNTAIQNGIYASSDGGSNFTFQSNVAFNTSNSCGEQISMTPSGTIIFVTLNIGSLFRSVNSGGTFSEVTGYLPSAFIPFRAIACSSDERATTVVAIGGGVYASDNGGDLFEEIRAPETYEYTSLAMNGEGTIIYVGSDTGGALLLGNKGGGGGGGGRGGDASGWTFTTGGGPTIYKWQQICCSSDAIIAYAHLVDISGGGTDNLLYKTTNRGVSWTQITSLEPTTSFNRVSCDATGTVVLVSAGPNNTLWVSYNGGTFFQEVIADLDGTPQQSLPNSSSCVLSSFGTYFAATPEAPLGGGKIVVSGTIGLA
jgi:hypothetical protein